MRLNQQNQVSKLLIPRDPTPEQKTEQRADHSKEQLKDNISRKSLKHSQKSQLTKLVNNPTKKTEFLKAAMKMSEKNLTSLEGRHQESDLYRPVSGSSFLGKRKQTKE